MVSEMSKCPSCHEKVGLLSFNSNEQKQLVCKECGSTVEFTTKSTIILVIPLVLFMALGIFFHSSKILPETLFENSNAVGTRGFHDNTLFAGMYFIFVFIWGAVWGYKFMELKVVPQKPPSGL